MVFVALLFSGGLLYAQDDQDDLLMSGGTLDPGDVLIEITGSPFDGSTLLSFGSFRARYAVTDRIVPRLGFNMDMDSQQPSPDLVTSTFEYTVAPGCEYHLAIEGSFRTYAALDVIVGQRTSKRESTTESSVSGSTSSADNITSSSYIANRGHFKLGVGLGVGADYYFSSRFYIGTEIGFQLVRENKSEIKIDGELYQDAVTNNYGSLNTMNTFKIGFKLL